MAANRFLIVTGLSGAGKTQVIRCLEDLGFFCVDNLPPKLIPKFAELCAQTTGRIERIALVVDIRGGEFFATVLDVLEDLEKQGIRYEVLYLEASNETLVRRFKESRRPHPLSPSGEVLEGIEAERQALLDLRGQAHKIIDTSNFSVTQLKQEIANLYGEDSHQERLAITSISFGYKYGIPLDADLVIDVRFLPNPHYVPELRPLTGLDEPVRKYVLESPTTHEFLAHLESLFNFLIPQYIREGKTTLTLAIGCTGGRHRSVAVADWLSTRLREQKHRIAVRHRDLGRNDESGANC
jgi:UPF0042 nucleotide-binding protein